jgi:Arc/MetJ family transcription regulator
MIMHKRTNIELDVNLINEAMALTELKTIKDVVHHSLRELIKLEKRKKLLSLKGKVNWEGNLDEMRSI